MEFFTLMNLDELAHGLSRLTMFPYFDMAHYTISILALREQAVGVEVSRSSPLACWFSSMLLCFGGAVVSGVMLAEPLVAPLTNSTRILVATIIWYLLFYCPMDLVYSCVAPLPIRLPLAAMKEVTRTWKVLGGVSQAQKKYKDSLLVMIIIGLARGNGGGLISNFEQLVRGVWKPETNELIKMSYSTKVSLMGAVLFSLLQTEYLPVQKHHLMLLYTTFLVVNKMTFISFLLSSASFAAVTHISGTRMMLMSSSSSPLAAIESLIFRTLFTGSSSYPALTAETSASRSSPRLKDKAKHSPKKSAEGRNESTAETSNSKKTK